MPSKSLTIMEFSRRRVRRRRSGVVREITGIGGQSSQGPWIVEGSFAPQRVTWRICGTAREQILLSDGDTLTDEGAEVHRDGSFARQTYVPTATHRQRALAMAGASRSAAHRAARKASDVNGTLVESGPEDRPREANDPRVPSDL